MIAQKFLNARIWHPIYGTGIITKITESDIPITWDNLEKRLSLPATIPVYDTKYCKVVELIAESTIVRKQPKNGAKPKRTMKTKKNKPQIDEAMMAIAAIGGTMRTSGNELWKPEPGMELSWNDIMFEDGYNFNKNDDNGGDDNDSGDSNDESGETSTSNNDTSGKSELRTSDGGGSDYVNVPRPADSILTNQEKQPAYKASPLSTMDGFEVAGGGDETNGDYGDDLLPPDAPGDISVKELEDTETRRNTRTTDDSENDTEEVGNDYDKFNNETKPEEGGKSDMKKNESVWLTAEDIGLVEMEQGTGYAEDEGQQDDSQYDDMSVGDQDGDQSGGQQDSQYDDMGSQQTDGGSGVTMARDLLNNLLSAVATQTPDAEQLEAICQGLEDAAAEKGSTLDVSDMDMIKEKMSSASGGEQAGQYDDMGGQQDGNQYSDAQADDEMPAGGGEQEDEAYFECGDGGSEYEDKAAGDGETAGPEGGREHEGRTKFMDNRGNTNEDSSGTPIGSGAQSGPGGGSSNDLSKPKSYNGKPLGTGTSGSGGSSSDNFGQKPSKDGGSNLLPAADSGSSKGAADNNFSKGTANPRNQKSLAAESRKGKGGKKTRGSRKRLEEALMLGMKSIPPMMRINDDDVPEDADWDEELNMIRRRAGMENWWK